MCVTAEDIRARHRKQANELPQTKRQQLLDLLREGKTLGEARKITDIDLHVAAEIVVMNISSYNFLNKTSV